MVSIFFQIKFAENAEKINNVKIIRRSFLKFRIPQVAFDRYRTKNQCKYANAPERFLIITSSVLKLK